MQPECRAEVPSRGQRLLLTQKATPHPNRSQGKLRRRRRQTSKWHRRDRSRSCGIALVAGRRLLKLLQTSVPHFNQNIYRQSLVLNPVFRRMRLPVRPWRYRVAPAAGELYSVNIRSTPCVLSHPMYTHTLVGFKPMKNHFQHQSFAAKSRSK